MTTTKVNSEFIAVNAISGTIIADGAITSTHLAANCVDSSELVTGSIDTIHIAANQVTATKIVTNGVLTRHISDDQVTAAKLANSINTDIATGVTANTTANAALPKAGGTMTGNITSNESTFSLINNDIRFKTSGAETMLRAVANGAVELMHNNSTKIATESGGVHITGYLDADNFKIAGAQGSDGQVLTSTGSGVAWEAAATSFESLSDVTVATSAPATNTNPSTGVGTLWLNRSAGEIYVCSDATSNANIWLNLGDAAQVGGLPSGGTESTAGGYKYHAFTSSGTLTIPAAKTGVDVLCLS